MALLDNVAKDADPIVAVLDFSQYVDGEKLSTLARQYFAAKGPGLGASTIEEYFAQLLLLNLKETLAKEAVEQITTSVADAEAEAKSKLELAEAQKLASAELIQSKIIEIEQVELVKK